MNRRPTPPRSPQTEAPSQQGQDELAACTRALAAKLDRQLGVEGPTERRLASKIPDFTDVLRRAAALEPGEPLHVPQSGSAPEDGPADVFEQALRGEVPALDPRLAEFVRARREQLEPEIQHRAARLAAEGWRGAQLATGTGTEPAGGRSTPVPSLGDRRSNWARRLGSAMMERPALATGLALAAALIMAISVGVRLAGDRSFADMLSVGTTSSLAANEAERLGTQGRARLRPTRSGGRGSGARGSSPERVGASAEQTAGDSVADDASVEAGALLNEASGVEAQLGASGRLSGPSPSTPTIAHRAVVQVSGAGAADEAVEVQNAHRSQVAGSSRQRRKWRQRRSQTGGSGLDARLLKLEAEARRAWRAGRLQRASSLYERLISRAGRRPVAERAFGDLFAIQRRLTGRRAQLSLWRRYLKRFPQGLYAADARAGLCTALPGTRASNCWRDYLQAHPQGPHAGRARRLLDAEL